MKPPKTLAEYAAELANVVKGRVIGCCPNHAIVETPWGKPIILPGPTQELWRRQCAKLVRMYQS